MNTKPLPPKHSVRELGFGQAAAPGRITRLVNRDGSFNVERRGLNFWRSWSLYHLLLTTSWPRFFTIVTTVYLATNAIFGFAYWLLPDGSLEGFQPTENPRSLMSFFFFSVQTLATIGYGVVHPVGLAANLLVTLEALAGLLEITLLTGMFFARVARPSARVRFSDNAIITPYEGRPSLQLRLLNERSSQLLEPRVQVVLARVEGRDGSGARRYYRLPLLLDHVIFFPAYWTVTHVIDEASPLFGATAQELSSQDAEILVLLTGTEETFSQTVHARMSYKFTEIRFGVRFESMYVPASDGKVAVDVTKLNALHPS